MCFYIGGVLNLLVIFLPLWCFIFKRNPVGWLVQQLSAHTAYVYLLVYWCVLVCAALYAVWWFSIQDDDDAVSDKGELPVTIARKTFHALAIMIYMPSLYYQTFTVFASCVTIVLFLIFELVRIFRIAPFGTSIDKLLQPLLDDHDSGKLITTHIYLLVGMSLPVGLYSTGRSLANTISELAIYSGVISIGVGDSCASVFGKIYGGASLLGSRKTWFGTFCCFGFQFAFVLVLVFVFGISCGFWDIVGCCFACLVVALLEGVSEQIDNIVLPLYMYVLLR